MDNESPDTDLTVYTIGHSNHSPETLLDLLKEHMIEVVADVRSSPYSQYASHFNKEVIQRPLRTHGIQYLFLGDVVGGRPDGRRFYDEQGYVLYDRVAQRSEFQDGIARLLEGIRAYRVVLFCSEEDPTDCHRRLLIGRVLRDRGVRLLHIRGDGRVQSEEDVAKQEEFQKTKGQLTLFDMQDPDEWKSSQSVSPKRAPLDSSGPSNAPESNE